MVPLSVLDVSPISAGFSGASSLRNTLNLARLTDHLGYSRYWLAEHHNLPSMASSASDILIGQVAAATTQMRVGSGGLMLPNHAPLSVAERFKTLEALFPGRIDLGLGRATGTDPSTFKALQRSQDIRDKGDFLERLNELKSFEQQSFPEGHPYRGIRAMPCDAPLPPVWLLGSTSYSAQLAGETGAGFSFAHHFSDYDAVCVFASYRKAFRPSANRTTPHAILACAAICADNDAQAQRIASTVDLHFIRRTRGEYLPFPNPQEAEQVIYSSAERDLVDLNRRRLFVGSARTVSESLRLLVAETHADELMVSTVAYDHEARRYSYILLAEAFNLQIRRHDYT